MLVHAALFCIGICLSGIFVSGEETGCLCSFTKKEIHEHFECPWEEKNRYNYDRYLEVAAEIDPMLSEGIYSPGANPVTCCLLIGRFCMERPDPKLAAV